MKLPIRLVPGTVPPKFEYYQTVNLMHGGVQSVQHVTTVSVAMERALVDLINIAQQLAKENSELRKKR